MSTVESPLMTVAEAALYLRCSEDKLREWIAAGKVRPYRPDGRGRRRICYIHRAELDRHIAASTVEGATPAAAPESAPVKGRAALQLAG